MTPSTAINPAEGQVVSATTQNVGQLLKSEGVVLIDFWATWCGPCRQQLPILDEVAKQVGGTATVAKLDVDASPEVAQHFRISTIPTLILFKDGKAVDMFVGVQDKEKLVAAIQSAGEGT